MELRPLRYALAKVMVIGPQKANEEAASSTESHSFTVVDRHAAVARKRLDVECLRGSRDAQPQQPLEVRKLGDARRGADVPLDVGADIVWVVIGRIDAMIVYPRVAAREQPLIYSCWRKTGRIQFRQRQRQEVEHSDAPRQRLVNRLHEQEVLRPRDDKLPGLARLVNYALDVGE